MRVADLAVRRVCFNHQSIDWDHFEDLQVFCSFEAAAIDADIQIQLYNLLDFLGSACEGMHDASGESGSVLLDNVVKIAASVAIMEVHR